jgi:Concanavalin A-like lectin/glucanases superfamily/Chitobiase/beta-hexosaminidase C-terminal domain/Family of unknown function (DUF6298)
MSKHLLYCKDLLNRTLTRSLLFTIVRLSACLIILAQAISPAEAIEPLSVKSTNPRYFFDSGGNPVFLTGSYLDQYNTLSGSWDFAAYLDSLQEKNQNFTRVWGWEQSPYERTGPGLALDGGPKFDLTRFNQVYFDQLRSRVVQAAQREIYVSVMLFEGFSTQKKLGRVDPLQQLNNINGINGDPNRNGSNEELFSLTYPSLLALEEAFLRKVVDTLNDLDNVLYEINGNGLAGSLSWQYHMIDYIRRYQKTTANQRPVGISDFYAGATAEVLKSSADWIVIQEMNSNPPPPTNKKILIMEGAPSASSGQALSALPISLFQLLPDSVVSSQSSSISNNVSSNGITLLSSSATSSTLNTTTSSSNNQQSQVATPTITPNGGVYSGTVAVTLQTTTPKASIYYTTDGQSPSQSSKRYNGKFTLSQSTLVKAKAFKNNFEPSSEASAWFANAANPAVSPSGLMAYWKFDEGSGTTVTDSSGNGNKGTLVNGPLWTAGRVGNALYFDGINDTITVPDSNSLDLSSSFTLSAWVNPASTFTDFRSILVKNYGYYLYASVAGYCGDGSPLGGFSGATAQTVCQPSPLPTNTWTHLAVTYNGSTLTFYRDGVPVTTSSVAGTFSPTTGILQIGGSQFGEYFKGLIDEVRIYNRALNDTEIQTVYQQESATPVQTVATPVISPSGGNYTGSVPVAMQTATSGASIYYTTNGSTPTQSSTLYAGTVTLTNNATVKAKAFKNGANASAEASASFTITQPFSFSLSNSGDKAVVAGSSVTNSIAATLVSGSTQAVSFSVSGLPSGATASLSSASCSPSCSSTLTINTTAPTAAGSSTITVTASGGGTTKTTTFSLNVSAQTVATPAISPNGGNFTNSAAVTMQTATSGASIYYTTDGSTPTQSSILYTGAITLTSSAVVKAKAFKSGSNPSAEASASFIVTPADLVAYWKFDEGSGTTTADASGNGNSGTLVNGPVWSAGRVGKALLFDGIDDSVTVADSNSLDLSSSFTLSAWVNPASTFNDFRSILVKNYSYYLYASVTGYCGDGTPLGGFSGATAQTVCQPSPLPTNTWTHLAVTYNGSTLTFYRDGVPVTTSSVAGTFSPTTGILQIGGSQFGEYFKGLIDEVRIYNRALNDTEIQTAYLEAATSQTVTPAIPNVSQPFSFSLSNSGDKSVVAGSSVTNSIAATLVSGTSQTVSFSVSGLPSGATGSFSSASCTPTCSTVFNIITIGATPAGNFPITITSTVGGVTRTTAFTLSVTAALTVATPTITPNGGNFSGSVSVAMQTTTSGASIYYTTNGSMPTQSSSLYTGAMTLTSDTTINAKAFKSGYNPSAVATASFTNMQIANKGATYWANTNGTASCADARSTTDPGPGRYRKLRDALACLTSPGDTLMVKSGDYLSSADNGLYTDFVNGTASAYTTLKCEVARTCIIRSDGYDGPLIEWGYRVIAYVEVNGFVFRSKFLDLAGTIVSIADFNWNGSCYDCGPHHIRLINGEIDGPCDARDCVVNWGPNCFAGGIPYLEVMNFEIHNCNYGAYTQGQNSVWDSNWFHHNVGYGMHMYCGAGCGVDPHPIKDNIIRNSLFEYNATLTGLYGGMSNCASQFIIADSDRNKFYNNVVRHGGFGPPRPVGEAQCGGGIVVYQGAKNTEVYNNTVYGNRTGPLYDEGSFNTTWINNIAWGNNVGGFPCPSGDISGCEYWNYNNSAVTLSNNMFQNQSNVIGSFSGTNTFGQNPLITSSSDARLQPGSPAISTGTDLSATFSTDAAGTTRPQGSAWDRGACEWSSGAGICPSLNVVKPSPAN